MHVCHVCDFTLPVHDPFQLLTPVLLPNRCSFAAPFFPIVVLLLRLEISVVRQYVVAAADILLLKLLCFPFRLLKSRGSKSTSSDLDSKSHLDSKSRGSTSTLSDFRTYSAASLKIVGS
ncbi:hypothetical protein LXL04_000069 [Taraxacum kok-saghyz]